MACLACTGYMRWRALAGRGGTPHAAASADLDVSVPTCCLDMCALQGVSAQLMQLQVCSAVAACAARTLGARKTRGGWGAQPLHPATCVGTCLLWNYEEVLAVLRGAGNVVATFSGHTHRVQTLTLITARIAGRLNVAHLHNTF